MADDLTGNQRKIANSVAATSEGHSNAGVDSSFAYRDSFPFWHLSTELFASRIDITEAEAVGSDKEENGLETKHSEKRSEKSLPLSNASPKKKKRSKRRKSSRTKAPSDKLNISSAENGSCDPNLPPPPPNSTEQDGSQLYGLHKQLMDEIERFDSKTLSHPPRGSFRRIGPFGCMIKTPYCPTEGSVSSLEDWDTEWDSDGWDDSQDDGDNQNPDLQMAAQQLQMLLAGEGLEDDMVWSLRENHPAKPPFPRGPLQTTECMVCFDTCDLHLRHCCRLPVCNDCLKEYYRIQVEQANVKLGCVNPTCGAYVHRDEIIFMLEPDMKDKFYRFLVDANKEPHIKTCPRCSKIMTIRKEELSLSKTHKTGLSVTCSECRLPWCFPCQAPWHEGVTCKQFKKGDKLLRQWAKEYHKGQPNAKRCPSCKIFIQRITGCDHMTCSGCKTEFCYLCGERFRQLKFIGNHYNRLSIFGCKYKYLPEKPVQRKLIRGSIFGGKLLAAPLLAGLAVCAGGVLLGVGAVTLPFYASYKLHKFIRHKKKIKRQRKHSEEMNRQMQAIREEYIKTVEYQSLRPRAPIVSETNLFDIRQWPLLEIETPQTENDKKVQDENGVAFRGTFRIPVDINHRAAQISNPSGMSRPDSDIDDDFDDDDDSDLNLEHQHIILGELLGLPAIDPNIPKYFLKVGQIRGKSEEKNVEGADANAPSTSSAGGEGPVRDHTAQPDHDNCNQSSDLNIQESDNLHPGTSGCHGDPHPHQTVTLATEKGGDRSQTQQQQPRQSKSVSVTGKMESNMSKLSRVSSDPTSDGSETVHSEKETGEVIYVTKL